MNNYKVRRGSQQLSIKQRVLQDVGSIISSPRSNVGRLIYRRERYDVSPFRPKVKATQGSASTISLLPAAGPGAKATIDYGEVSKLRPHKYTGIPAGDPTKDLVLDAADPNSRQEATFSQRFSKAALGKPVFEKEKLQESTPTPTGRSSRASLGGRNAKLGPAAGSRQVSRQAERENQIRTLTNSIKLNKKAPARQFERPEADEAEINAIYQDLMSKINEENVSDPLHSTLQMILSTPIPDQS